jgi:hypothetical protein
LPDTLAEPTVAPPEVQVAGGEDCGPNTLNLTLPIGADPLASVAESEEAGIAVPAAVLAGALVASVGLAGWALSSTPCWLPALSS